MALYSTCLLILRTVALALSAFMPASFCKFPSKLISRTQTGVRGNKRFFFITFDVDFDFLNKACGLLKVICAVAMVAIHTLPHYHRLELWRSVFFSSFFGYRMLFFRYLSCFL